MKNRRVSEVSESEESEEEQNLRQPSTSKNVAINNEDSSSNSSSESEGTTKPPSPPPVAQKRRSATSASPKKNVTFNPLERFINENKNLTKLDVGNVVTEEDEVCLLEVPKAIDPSELLDRIINFDRKTKIKVNKTKYVIEPESEVIQPINLLNRKLQIIHPISVLRMRQYSKRKQDSEAVNEITTPPALPDKLKVRHPLFGSEFKRKITLDEEIQRKLDVTIDQVMKKMKKKKHKDVETSHKFVTPMETSDSGKKKKHKKKATESSAHEQDNTRQANVDESIFALLETHIAKKSKKGHKKVKEEAVASSSDSGIFADVKSEYEREREHKKSNEGQDTTNSGYEQKKKKKNSITEAEGASFEHNKQKHKNSINKDVSGEYEHKRKHKNSIRENEDDNDHGYKKKHKNSMKEADDVSSDDEYQEKHKNIKEESIEDTKRKRKNSQKGIRNGQDESSFYNSLKKKEKNQNTVEQETNDSKESKSNSMREKKKKQKTSMTELSQGNDSFVDNNSFEEDTTKKKKKHRHIKQEKIDVEHEQDVEEANESLKHNKRKNSTKTDTDIKEQEENDCKKDNKSEKIKRSSLINSTVIPGVQLPLFEFDVSGIMNQEEQGVRNSSINNEETPEEEKSHKDRRKKEVSFEFDNKVVMKEKKIKKEKAEHLVESDYNQSVSPRKRKKTSAESEDEDTTKKKRKRIKEEVVDDEEDNGQTNSLILNLLNKVKSEMDTSVNHKKKKK